MPASVLKAWPHRPRAFGTVTVEAIVGDKKFSSCRDSIPVALVGILDRDQLRCSREAHWQILRMLDEPQTVTRHEQPTLLSRRRRCGDGATRSIGSSNGTIAAGRANDYRHKNKVRSSQLVPPMRSRSPNPQLASDAQCRWSAVRSKPLKAKTRTALLPSSSIWRCPAE